MYKSFNSELQQFSKKMLLILFSCLVLFNPLYSKDIAKKGVVFGTVIDANSKLPLEYVTISLFNNNEDLVGGAITTKSGEFEIESIKKGSYKIVFSFLGYESITLSDIEIGVSDNRIDIGIVKLALQTTGIGEVEVKAHRNNINYKLDKKVIEVSNQLIAISGTAVDALKNAPSVNVDFEGNVSLRGSTDFKVLINNVPTVLEPSEALQQIPANSIENIEIITNPSAKYSPDGASGIINVITKKNKQLGLNGVANTLIGNRAIGGDVMVSKSSDKFGYYLGADYNYRDYPGDKYGNRTSEVGDSSFYLSYDGDIYFGYERYHFKGGIEYTADSLNVLNIDFLYSDREREKGSKLFYSEWNNYESDKIQYKSKEGNLRIGKTYSGSLNFKHSFKPLKHYLKTSIDYRKRDGKEYNDNVLFDIDNIKTEGRDNTDIGSSSVFQVKLDYVLDKENYKFEVGYEGFFNSNKNEIIFKIDAAGTGNYVFDPKYSKKTEFKQDINSLYAIYGYNKSKLSYQVGLRSEYINRNINLKSTAVNENDNADFSLNKVNIFPSVHLAYNLPKRNELSASYSRRINRAENYFLEPFYIWMDAYNVRVGNADLKPQFIDSYELNYLKKYDKSYFSFEVYHRVTDNYVEWVRSVYKEDKVLRKPYNVGKAYSTGIDGTVSFNVFKWWRADYSGSIFNYKLKGVLEDRVYSDNSFRWNTSLNNTFTVLNDVQIQALWQYFSKRISSQGYFDPVYALNVGIKKDFFNKKVSSLFQVVDVFGTNRRRTGSKGLNFDDFYFQTYHTPVLTLNLTYRFNNSNSSKKKNRQASGFSENEYED